MESRPKTEQAHACYARGSAPEDWQWQHVCCPSRPGGGPRPPGPMRRRPAGAAGVAFPDWARYARLADGTFDDDADPERDMLPVVKALKAQNVSVIELDTVLSNWLTDQQFTAHMGKVKSFADLAHATRCGWSCTTPRSKSSAPGGEKGPSFYKNGHGKDWVQRGLDGSPTSSTAAWSSGWIRATRAAG